MTMKPDIEIRSIDLRIIPRALLLEADPSEERIASYPESCVCFAAWVNGHIIGACVFGPMEGSTVELLNIVVTEGWQQKGIGTRLLQRALDEAKSLQADELVLGTGMHGHQLQFYLDAGFELMEIQKEYFLHHYPEPLFENGKQHIDRAWLRYRLR